MELKKLFDYEHIKKIVKMMNDKSLKDRFGKIHDSMDQFVKDTLPKLDKKKLKIVKIGGGHSLRFFDNWNNFIKGKLTPDDQQYNLLVSYWSSALTHYCIYAASMKITSEKELFDRILKGHFDIPGKECKNTGDHLSIHLNENLEFTFEKFLHKKVTLSDGRIGHSGSFVPINNKNVFKDTIYEKIIEFKTGNLIINDWFRTSNNEFSKAVRDDELDFDLNSTKGKVESISHYADQNFVSVNIGNTMGGVYVVGDKIYVGEAPEMDEGKIYKGSICTDLWNGSIIEEEHLVDLLVKNGMTKAKAKSELKALKKIWTCISIKVKPGKYKLSFCGNYYDFNKKYRAKHKDHKLGKYKPYFTLEKIK